MFACFTGYPSCTVMCMFYVRHLFYMLSTSAHICPSRVFSLLKSYSLFGLGASRHCLDVLTTLNSRMIAEHTGSKILIISR